MSNTKMVCLVVAAVVLCVVSVFVAVIHDKRACAAKGGHLVTVYKSSLCVSEDGRIIG